jgi:hypothetical protein
MFFVEAFAEFLEDCRLPFIEKPDLVQKLKLEGFFEKAAWGFMQGLVAKAEGPKMHRDHHLGPELTERLKGLFGVHVDVAFGGRFVGADGEQGKFDVGALADFLEAFKVGRVAAMENSASGVLDEEATESSVAIMEDSCSPVSGWGQGDLEGAVFETLPVSQLMDSIESQIMNEIADMLGHGDGLVAGNGAQRAPVEVIEMRVSNQNEIDGGEIAERDSRMLDPFDHLEPPGPVRVYEHAMLRGLNEEGRMSDPCHAEFSGWKFREGRLEPAPVAFGKKRGNNDLGKKVSLVPPFAEPHVHVILRLCALSCS